MLCYLQKSPVRKGQKKNFLVCQNQNVLLTGLIPAFSPGPACKNMKKSAYFPTDLLTAPRLCRARLWSPPLFSLTPLPRSRGLQEQEAHRLPPSSLVGCGLAAEADGSGQLPPTPALGSEALLAF